MLRRIFLVLMLAVAATPAAEAAGVKVGMVTRSFTDDSRKEWDGSGPRSLTTHIWYPTPPTRKVEMIFIGPVAKQVYDEVPVGRDAPVAKAKAKYPLVLLSHTSESDALQMIWLGHQLASRGYIAAAVNHHANTSTLVWERARDLSVVLDKLLADPTFGSRIDAERVGAAGFGLGGYTVIALAGGRYSPDTFQAFCRSDKRDATCESQPKLPDELQVNESIARSNDSFRDQRIKAVFAIAPVLAQGFIKDSFSDVTVPVRIVAADADTAAPMQTNAVRYVQSIPKAELTAIPGNVNHNAFMATCTRTAQRTLPICKDPQGVDRPRVHREVSNMAFEFFERSSLK